MSRARLRAVCAALLAAEAAWAAASLLFPALPGWRMFARVEDMPAALEDGSGRRYRLLTFVPGDVYVTSMDSERAIARFVCASRPDERPWTLLWGPGGRQDACAQ